LKKIITLFLVLTIATFPVNASAQEKNSVKITSTVAPATESTINGIPESQIIKPMDVFVQNFVSYNQNSYVTIDRFKSIVTFDHDNTRNSQPYTMTVTVSNSTSQASEWGGSITFTAGIKMGILGSVNTAVGITHKDTRTTNEAVGASGSTVVPAYKTGHIKFWYKGRSTGGTLTYSQYFTQDPTNIVYGTVPVSATFYATNKEIFSEAWSN